MVPNDSAFAGVCPYHGACLEGLASGPALAARWSCDPASLADDHPAWDIEARHLAHAVMTLTYTLVPDVVVLGGGVGRRPGLAARVTSATTTAMAGYLSPPRIVPPSLPDGRSGITGALTLALDG
jgi:fructokinase